MTVFMSFVCSAYKMYGDWYFGLNVVSSKVEGDKQHVNVLH